MHSPRAKTIRYIVIGGSLLILCIWSLLPIVWNMLTSIKSRTDIFAMPPKLIFEPNFDAYRTAFGRGGASILPNLTNSLIIALGTMFATLIIASLAAYAFSHFRFRGRSSLMMTVLATRLLPPISAVVPLFMLMNSLRLIDTHLVLILIYSALSVPFATWLIKAFIDAIPRELEESAMVEGCTALGALWRITIPLAAPGLATTAVFVFVLAWNEFLFAFLFTSVDARTMPVLIAQARGDDQFLWQQMASQATVLMFPALLLGLYLQRYLVKGMTAGAVK
jgi:multiple sugar transport system permease protein